jgi:hypothetical protein
VISRDEIDALRHEGKMSPIASLDSEKVAEILHELAL